MKTNNKVIIDLTKCSYAWQSWVTECGNYKRTSKPEQPTVHGQEFDCDAPAYCCDSPMTMLDRAQYIGILDDWIPCVTFQIMANHRLTFTGEKAEALWKKWCDMQFNKKNKTK